MSGRGEDAGTNRGVVVCGPAPRCEVERDHNEIEDFFQRLDGQDPKAQLLRPSPSHLWDGGVGREAEGGGGGERGATRATTTTTTATVATTRGVPFGRRWDGGSISPELLLAWDTLTE